MEVAVIEEVTLALFFLNDIINVSTTTFSITEHNSL